ncbi:MAG: hypothetical protein K8T91_24710, partial [Planctomycetes bacterium]|nr:hypothetical protein [Planctomycetota bacterium]
FTAWRGVATPQALTLGDDTITYDRIVDRAVVDDRLILGIASPETLSAGSAKFLLPGGFLPLVVYSVAGPLLRTIDRYSSLAHCEAHRRQLTANGKENEYYSIDCPNCQAAVDLSELSETPYVYCGYCESIISQTGELVTNGQQYRVCEACRMFDRVRGHTEFYFYFLLVVYGFSSNRKHVCDACAHGLFIKTLLANALFVLGIPNAIAIKIRSLTGRDPRLNRLSQANRLALSGSFERSTPLYREMHQAIQGHPGLLYNEALGYFQGNRTDEGAKLLEAALKSCANYGPVLRILAEAHQQAAPAEK